VPTYRWERRRRGAWLPLGVAVLGLVVIGLLQSIPNRHTIEADLTNRSVHALRDAGLSTVDVSFTGRDGTVRAHSADDANRAAAIVRDVDGVRVVVTEVVPANNEPTPAPSPAPSAAPSPSPSPSGAPADSAVRAQLAALPRITFELGSAALTADGQAVVAKAAAVLRDNPGVRVRIEGHTDSTGNDRANQELSLARAQTVLDALVAQGVSADRLSALGFGSTRPEVPDTTLANQAINRRVAFVVQP
jgi:outer membrane protein OmpA-like peptidoglycan-associated protein